MNLLSNVLYSRVHAVHWSSELLESLFDIKSRTILGALHWMCSYIIGLCLQFKLLHKFSFLFIADVESRQSGAQVEIYLWFLSAFMFLWFFYLLICHWRALLRSHLLLHFFLVVAGAELLEGCVGALNGYCSSERLNVFIVDLQFGVGQFLFKAKVSAWHSLPRKLEFSLVVVVFAISDHLRPFVCFVLAGRALVHKGSHLDGTDAATIQLQFCLLKLWMFLAKLNDMMSGCLIL